jgi:hypothetical protein
MLPNLLDCSNSLTTSLTETQPSSNRCSIITKDIEDRPIFLFQPEAFLILERVEHDPHVLEETWVNRYPRGRTKAIVYGLGSAIGLKHESRGVRAVLPKKNEGTTVF